MIEKPVKKIIKDTTPILIIKNNKNLKNDLRG